MLLLASALNYLDRQTLSILAPTMQNELNVSEQDYAFVINLFLIAYTAATLLSGLVVDYLGARLSLAIFVGWWSIANILTGFARSFVTLCIYRFLLGIGEAGNWTAAPKAVSEWFPAKERSLAIGVYTMGATIGATIAPLLVVNIASIQGWRMAFVATGTIGLLWLATWLWLYRRPRVHPRLSDIEREYIQGGNPDSAPAASGRNTREGWLTILSRRDVWLLMLARLLTDPVWYFYQFWFAKYLFSERGVSQTGLSITFLIFLAADLGAFGGGWFSGRLTKAHRSPVQSWRLVMTAAACLMPLSVVVPRIDILPILLSIGMVIAFGHMMWLVNLTSLVVDVIPQRSLATTFGVIAVGSALGAIVMNWAVGLLITHHSYGPAFVAMAGLHPLALPLIWRLRGMT